MGTGLFEREGRRLVACFLYLDQISDLPGEDILFLSFSMQGGIFYSLYVKRIIK
jgi:hypothetical protein